MASLLGRILRSILVLVVAFTVLVTAPLQAAPFAAIVIDARTGEVLYEQNADARLHPASLTKMMTLYIAFQEIEAGRLSLDTRVTVSKYAASQPPSRLGLKPGQKIALRYLIRAAAVKSANDAAAAIGDHISGDREAFAKRMTRTAKELGMTGTTFRNAHGLTADGHLSTARDMNTLGRHLFYDFPQYYNIFSRRTADAGVAQVTNTNSRFLDGYEGADGIKTGYTSAAGFNLTASAVRGKKRIIATVFGGTSTANRNAKMKELMDLGFGAAKNRVKEQPPRAPGIPAEDALIASLPTHAIDDLDAEGGAGKTVRVSGAMTKSLRPKARPTVAEVPEAVAVAMADGIADALAE
ncbi:MAG: D-alanyl-D-alanine carboxypeptidase, partial [Rhodobacteraceae bacterium]|nr:D-alanyl-D-alanine carboxypeptidase [Paracoccaceae bacterium]